MKAKQLIVLAALLVVAVIVAIAVNGSGGKGDKKEGLAAGDVVLGDLPINEIATMKIVGDESSVELERAAGKWVVKDRDGYPADFGKISRVLKDLLDLKVAEARRAGASAYGRFELKAPEAKADENAGVQVDLSKEGGGTLASLVLGKRYSGATDGSGQAGGGSGRYVRNAANEGQVYIVSEALSDFDPSPSSWLQRDFFRVQKHEKVNVGHADGTVFAFSREKDGGDLSLDGLAADEELNTANTGTLGSAFSSASFRDVVVGDAAKPEATGLDKPVVVDITTFDGFTYSVKLGKTEAAEKIEGDDGGTDGAAEPKPTFYLSFEVDAKIVAERAPGEDENAAEDATDEDKKKVEELKKRRDDEFAAEKKRLEEKLETEKAFVGNVYEIDSWSAEKFFMERDKLVKKKEKPEAGATPGPGGLPVPSLIPGAPIQGLPGITIPGASVAPPAPKNPVTATTPAISAGSPVGDGAEDADEDGETVKAPPTEEPADGSESEESSDGDAAAAEAIGEKSEE
jgi:hypothetical protein